MKKLLLKEKQTLEEMEALDTTLEIKDPEAKVEAGAKDFLQASQTLTLLVRDLPEEEAKEEAEAKDSPLASQTLTLLPRDLPEEGAKVEAEVKGFPVASQTLTLLAKDLLEEGLDHLTEDPVLLMDLPDQDHTAPLLAGHQEHLQDTLDLHLLQATMASEVLPAMVAAVIMDQVVVSAQGVLQVDIVLPVDRAVPHNPMALLQAAALLPLVAAFLMVLSALIVHTAHQQVAQVLPVGMGLLPMEAPPASTQTTALPIASAAALIVMELQEVAGSVQTAATAHPVVLSRVLQIAMEFLIMAALLLVAIHPLAGLPALATPGKGKR